MHGQNAATPNQIAQHIKSDMKLRTVGIKSVHNDSINRLICHNWGLDFI